MYFPLLSLHGWGKRLGEGRRHNCAVMPKKKFAGYYRMRYVSQPYPRTVCIDFPILFHNTEGSVIYDWKSM